MYLLYVYAALEIIKKMCYLTLFPEIISDDSCFYILDGFFRKYEKFLKEQQIL